MLLSALSSFAVSFLCGVVKDLFTAWQAKRTAAALGRAEAVAEGHARAEASARIARTTEVETAAAHSADATDAAFDQSFMRRD